MDVCNNHLFGLIIILAILIAGVISTINDRKEN